LELRNFDSFLSPSDVPVRGGAALHGGSGGVATLVVRAFGIDRLLYVARRISSVTGEPPLRANDPLL